MYITLIPEWEVGTISSVHLTQSPTGGQMPQIPDSLSSEQQRDLRRLLDEYKDVFSKEGNPISSTSLVEHEIHTEGPSNPVAVSTTEFGSERHLNSSKAKEMLRDEVIRPFHQPLGLPSGDGEKEGWVHEVLCGFP